MAALFERDIKTIEKHINNVLNEELDSSAVAKFATTAADGKTYQTEHYNLDMIISVGYRVKSWRGVQFRKWANQRSLFAQPAWKSRKVTAIIPPAFYKRAERKINKKRG